VIDVQARRMFIFRLQDNGIYQESDKSQALDGLTKDLLEQTLARTQIESNGNIAMWFAQQLLT
jgi:hypothetical protein